jgi:hypothetical protein
MDVMAVDKSAKRAAPENHELCQGVRDNMDKFLIYGMPKHELEDILLRAFTSADKDGTGRLDKAVRNHLFQIVVTIRVVIFQAYRAHLAILLVIGFKTMIDITSTCTFIDREVDKSRAT